MCGRGPVHVLHVRLRRSYHGPSSITERIEPKVREGREELRLACGVAWNGGFVEWTAVLRAIEG